MSSAGNANSQSRNDWSRLKNGIALSHSDKHIRTSSRIPSFPVSCREHLSLNTTNFVLHVGSISQAYTALMMFSAHNSRLRFITRKFALQGRCGGFRLHLAAFPSTIQLAKSIFHPGWMQIICITRESLLSIKLNSLYSLLLMAYGVCW